MILVEDNIIHRISLVLKDNPQCNAVILEKTDTGVSVAYIKIPVIPIIDNQKN